MPETLSVGSDSDGILYKSYNGTDGISCSYTEVTKGRENTYFFTCSPSEGCCGGECCATGVVPIIINEVQSPIGIFYLLLIVVVALLLITLVCLFCCCLWRRRNKKEKHYYESGSQPARQHQALLRQDKERQLVLTNDWNEANSSERSLIGPSSSSARTPSSLVERPTALQMLPSTGPMIQEKYDSPSTPSSQGQQHKSSKSHSYGYPETAVKLVPLMHNEDRPATASSSVQAEESVIAAPARQTASFHDADELLSKPQQAKVSQVVVEERTAKRLYVQDDGLTELKPHK